VYCLNSNTQATNQFLTYPSYHHADYHSHHQYFDENLHHYVPYANETYAPIASTTEHQENFIPTANTTQPNNDLYEFLPEEIFQLDQPIVKNEAQNFNNSNSASAENIIFDSMAQEHVASSYNTSANNNNNNNNEANTILQANQSFLDLSSGQIQNGSTSKFMANVNYSEINNNSNYASQIQQQHHHQHQQQSINQESVMRGSDIEKTKKQLAASYQAQSSSYQCNATNPKLFFQQSANYYVPEIYTSSSTSNKANNDNLLLYHRSMEKYNYVVNN
jgi:hypothetical protein